MTVSAQMKVRGGGVCVHVSEKDLVRKRAAMYHFPFAKLPALTGSSHMLVERERARGDRLGLNAPTRKKGEGGTQKYVISSSAAPTKCTGHQLVTYMGVLRAARKKWKRLKKHSFVVSDTQFVIRATQTAG